MLVYKMYKKILFNASTLTVGGGIQAARTFIEDIYNKPSNLKFLFLLSPEGAIN